MAKSAEAQQGLQAPKSASLRDLLMPEARRLYGVWSFGVKGLALKTTLKSTPKGVLKEPGKEPLKGGSSKGF